MEQVEINTFSTKNMQKDNKSKSKLVFLSLILFAIISSIILIYTIFNKSANVHKQTNESSMVAEATPTPMPFYEMTVPYLREKEYKSNLGEQVFLNRNSNYSSYLTNYVSDGLRINALLTIPYEERPIEGYPAIVFVHGYIPPTLYQTNGAAYSSYVDYFARNGYVVFKIDLRGHGNSEGEAGGGYYGADYVVDALNAYAALSVFDQVNPEKIGMWGHSMAGNILLRSAVIKQNIPAVDIWGGAVFTYLDRLKYGISDNSYRPPTTQNEIRRRRQLLTDTYGEFDEKSTFWTQVAPTNYLKDIKGAIQLDHAVDDATVNVGYSRDLAALLEENGVNYALNEYPSGGHDIEGVSFGIAMKNSVEFFNKYLKN